MKFVRPLWKFMARRRKVSSKVVLSCWFLMLSRARLNLEVLAEVQAVGPGFDGCCAGFSRVAKGFLEKYE